MSGGLLVPTCVLNSAARGGGSAAGALDGRQRQDAAIVGVESLCVAPRPGNRQQ